MEKKLNRLTIILKILILSLFINSCNGQHKTKVIEKSKEEIIKHNNDENTDFLDKKYLTGYLLNIDGSSLSEHPIVNYLDCENEGYFTMHFIPKSDTLRVFWTDKYNKIYKYEYDDLDTENKHISGILKNNYNLYNIFLYKINKEYIVRDSLCSKESVNIKDNSIANIYLLDQTNNSWNLIKQLKENVLPPYHDNNYFLKLFPKLFSFDKVLKLNENRNVAYSYDFDLDQDGIKDKIMLYANDEEKGDFERIHFGLPMEIKKGLPNNTFQKWYENNNIIPKNNFNCVAEGFNRIVFKGNYFTIEDYICSDYISISTYTTFKVFKDKILLHKYSQTYFDKADHDKKIPSKTWTQKDFNDVNFENVTEDFLLKISQTKPKQ
ncbi:hypothetical protein SAMN05444671_1233 [Flavobacterium sp. CF108]|uniref:hypothetical protein n=1 Tax=unclassified Flavobacterium TaxID=196869 RepID=UPI0008CE5941|nr:MULTISPECIES: hypothetical protein [unclassified Flavobacterium]SEO85076.1 hypothetical protein SAMN04487978_3820 [Flavobacterium sp. fv08]SHG70191.1 hypothetical protein SAMN05444671_1233 [Flavobacterium sp. CF108]